MSRARNHEPNNYNRKKNGKRLLINKTIDSLASIGLELSYKEFNKVYLHDDELAVGISIPGTLWNEHNQIEFEMTERENTSLFFDIFQNNQLGQELYKNISRIQYNDYMDQLNVFFECDKVRFPSFIQLLSKVNTCTSEFDKSTVNGNQQKGSKELKQTFGDDMYVQTASRDDFPIKLLLRNVFMTRKFKAGITTEDTVLDAIGNKLIDVLKIKNTRNIKLTRWKYKNKASETALLELKLGSDIEHIINQIKTSNAQRVFGYAPFKITEFKNKNESYYNAKMHSAIIRLKKLKEEQKQQQEAIRLAAIEEKEEALHKEYEEEQERLKNMDQPPNLTTQEETDKIDIAMEDNNNNNNNNTTEIEMEIINNINNNINNNTQQPEPSEENKQPSEPTDEIIQTFGTTTNSVSDMKTLAELANVTPLPQRKNKSKSRTGASAATASALEKDLKKDPDHI